MSNDHATDAYRRREWAAALRWEASQYRATDPATAFGEITAAQHYATVLEVDAARIEAGHLSPWDTDTTGEDTQP